MRHVLCLLVFFGFTCNVMGQKEFTVTCIAFYNLENLFDTLDSSDTDDLEFTPAGPNLYNSFVYYDKLGNLSKVIAEIGAEITPDGPALPGVSEIENISVSVIMGDLNDDPVNESVHKYLHAERKTESLGLLEMYNPMEDFYREGFHFPVYVLMVKEKS